jgi:Intracellular proteinase inhibitor
MAIRRWSGHSVLSVSLLAASCAPGSDVPRSSNPPAPPATPAPDSAAMTEPGSDSLQVSLEVSTGEPIRFTFRARNAAPRQVALLLRGRSPTLDIEVRQSGSEVVWHRLEGEIIQAIVQVRILEPEEVLEVEAEWDGRLRDGSRVAPGDYQASALLLLEEGGLASPVTDFRLSQE